MDLKESKILIEELMKMKKNLENQNISLEMEVKASQKIIKNLKRETTLLDEYEEAAIDRDDSIRKFERGKTIPDDVIKNLKKELNLCFAEYSQRKRKSIYQAIQEQDFLRNRQQ